MTPREKALEAALQEVLAECENEGHAWHSNTGDILAKGYAALDTPSDWLPTPLADPPGDAVIEDGDWVMTRSGCVLGPVTRTSSYCWGWRRERWLSKTGEHTLGQTKHLDITHVRKAVK